MLHSEAVNTSVVWCQILIDVSNLFLLWVYYILVKVMLLVWGCMESVCTCCQRGKKMYLNTNLAPKKYLCLLKCELVPSARMEKSAWGSPQSCSSQDWGWKTSQLIRAKPKCLRLQGKVSQPMTAARVVIVIYCLKSTWRILSSLDHMISLPWESDLIRCLFKSVCLALWLSG